MAPRKGKGNKPISRQRVEKNNTTGRRCKRRFLVEADDPETRCYQHQKNKKNSFGGSTRNSPAPAPQAPKPNKKTPPKRSSPKDPALEPESEPEEQQEPAPKPATKNLRKRKPVMKLKSNEMSTSESKPKPVREPKRPQKPKGKRKAFVEQEPDMEDVESEPVTKKPRESKPRKKPVPYWEGILTAEEALDPDYELDQYDDKLVISKRGFRDRRPSREVTDLPQDKQSKVRKLQQARERAIRVAEGKETHFDEIRSQEAERKAEEEEIKSAREKSEIEERLRKRERDATTVEGRYFLYRYRRNVWRQSIILKDPEADISDEVYRETLGLPIYEDEDEWRETLYFRKLGMTLLCETHEIPNDVWTMEEKRVMKDMEEVEGDLIDKQEKAIGKYFNGRPPGERDYKRAKRKMSEGQELSEGEEFLLNNAALFQVQLRAEAEQTALDEAHRAVSEGEIDQELIERDDQDARELQELAAKEARKALASQRTKSRARL